MPPRRARVPATLESRIKQGLQYFLNLRENAAADEARAEDLDDAIRVASLELVSSAEILSGIVAAHGWAARTLAVDVMSRPACILFESAVNKLEELLSSQSGDPGCDQRDGLVRALLRADTLAVYARLCARTNAPTRRNFGANRMKRDVIYRLLHNLSTIARGVNNSRDNSLRQELISALAHTQLLEHAARALLHAAQSIQPAPSAAAVIAAASGRGPPTESWENVSAAASAFSHTLMFLPGNMEIFSVSPQPREKDICRDAVSDVEALLLLEQVRPLLAGRCVQLVVGWAGLCGAMTLQQQEGAADGGDQQGLVPTASQLRHGLPSELIRPLQLLPQVTLSSPDLSVMACVIVLQVTVSGPCDLAIAQPPLGYDRLPHRQPQPQQPLAGPSAAGSAAAEGPAAAPAPASYSAAHAYRLLMELWCGLACDSDRGMRNKFLVAPVMARLLTELRPRQAAVLLPGWWRLLAQDPPMLTLGYRLAQDAGELLRLQLSAPPPAAWAAGVTDAASVAAASVDWPLETAAEMQGAEAATAAKAAASLARGRDPSFSLRCALDAGLLPAVERCLRAPQAWQQADSASKLLYVVNCVLRYSGVWPAVLARGPLQQAVSLIATLGATARLVRGSDSSLDVIRSASQPGMQMTVECGAWGYLCAYLSSMLEQVADLRALHERAQQQREGQQAAATDATATAAVPTPLHLNSVLEQVVESKDGSVKPSTCSIAWMAAAGGLPAAGSTADRQQQLLTSFAVYQWLPMLAEETAEVLLRCAAGAGRRLPQALLVGHLLMDVLWREERRRAEDDVTASGGAEEQAWSPRPDGAWWEGVTLAGQLAVSVHQIVHVLAIDAGGVLPEHCEPQQQAAVLDLLQSYWTRFAGAVRVTIRARAIRAAEQQQQRQRTDGGLQAGQQADGGAGSSTSSLDDSTAQQQPPPPELMLQCLTPLPVQQLAAAHGRQDVVDYLDAVTEVVREELLIECGGAGAGGSGIRVQGLGSREGGASHASATADRLGAKWVSTVRPRYLWLLSQGQVQAGLHGLMVAEAAAATAAAATGEPAAACGGGDGSGGRSGSSSNTTSGGGQGSRSGGPVFEPKLCCNPRCCSLDGFSALIAPRSGKTCVRCRAATYCCGACQLADWRERHSGTCSGAAAAAAGSAEAAKAGLKKA
ncbi:hypothetical protein CHLRE_07g343300v5 [Chlamydomonas reinhardtii]|uniref:phytol kinase n=1 Tax=Chlamydomonas reinhardtii TaxID=3055 RepID=A0A2K3DKP3_CHLRE|nr:uncharacterized protein CHLRE_07g343300v5 [Chlamydomonas reinhardtii]PNW81117.1 hypothetical protein CHLRE_07g343300v5 [Chlamydomonas reinhardtii]